jgi:hypothetical protein
MYCASIDRHVWYQCMASRPCVLTEIELDLEGMLGVGGSVGCVHAVSRMISLFAVARSFSRAVRSCDRRVTLPVRVLHRSSYFVTFSVRSAFSDESVVAVSYQYAVFGVAFRLFGVRVNCGMLSHR